MSNVKKNFTYQIIYRILTVLTPFITSPIVSRALGAQYLGVYSATLSFVNYFMLFAMLGVETYGSREIATAQGDPVRLQNLFWNIYIIQFIASMLSIICYTTSIILIDSERFILACCQGIWLISCLLDINWFFFGIEKFKLTVTRNIIVKIITVTSIVLFVRDQDDLLLYAFIMAGGTAITQLIMWKQLFHFISFEKPTWYDSKRHVIPVIRLFIPVLASCAQILDKTMLDVFSSEKELGYYYSADKIIYIPLGVISALNTVLLPRISNIIYTSGILKAKKLINESIEVILFLTSAVAFGLACIAENFVPAFFGSGYEKCIVLIYCFIPFLFVKSISDLIRSQYLIPVGKDKIYTWAIVIGSFTNVFTNFWLIQYLGSVGAVIGTFIAEVVILFVQLLGAKEMQFPRMVFKQSVYLIVGAVMLLFDLFLAQHLSYGYIINSLILFISGGVVYIIGCSIVWKVNKKSVFHNAISDMKNRLKFR